MKKTLLALSLFATTAFAEPTVGVGEYNFGPNTPESLACSIAEEKAKEAAILNKVGEVIELMEYQTCNSTNCDHKRDFLNNITGVIRSIIDSKIDTIMREGMRTCIVTIKADVHPVKNDISFYIHNDNFKFKHDEEIIFTGVSSHVGKVILFNQEHGKYMKVYETIVEHPGYEFKIPDDNHRIMAKLPDHKQISQERLLFLFLEVDISVKEVYNHKEFQKLLESVPVLKRRTIYQLTQIVR